VIDFYIDVTARMGFAVRDLDGVLKAGLLPVDFTVDIYSRGGTDLTYTLVGTPAGTGYIADRGGGMYDLSFTPNAGHAAHWFIFQVHEPAYVNGALLIHTFTAYVTTATVTVTETDTFCTIADVSAKVQRGTFGGDTVPTSDQVLRFMVDRAGEIQAVLTAGKFPHTPDSGANPFGTDAFDLVAKSLCRLCNSIGAAGDAVHAHTVRDNPEPSERAVALWNEYHRTLDSLARTLDEQTVTRRACAVYTEASTAADTFAIDLNTEW
jgi:hypothetical protein